MPNVTVSTPQTIKVQIGSNQPKVQSLAYGTKTLKSASDLNSTGAQDKDVIVYNSSNNTFYTTSIVNSIPELDAGFF
jgi:hypothetical protein